MRRGGRRRPHRVIAAHHARELGLRHVAIDAGHLAVRMMAVRHPVLHARLVAGQTRLVGAGRLLEAIAAARRVAVQTIELSRLRARAAAPRGERVVLAEVPAVGIEVRALQANQIERVEVTIAGAEAVRQRRHPRVTGSAHLVLLVVREAAGRDQLRARRDLFVAAANLADRADVRLAGAVARFAVDAWLGPGGPVRVRRKVVVAGELTDVAAVAGAIEGQLGIGPVHGPLGHLGEVAERARGDVVPFLAPHVVRHREDLQAAAFVGRQKEVHVLATHDVRDAVIERAARAGVAHLAGRHVGAIAMVGDDDVLLLWRQLLAGERGREGLHRQAVTRGGPESVEILVATAALDRS